ncbi:hypothetical protein BLNAU_5845 [Blattamonas nauphoetae]|uniref:Uncharacterized protein n=1 Tax=Blattamonas nauphoetae TaxID=2049346 RepID=A0ABQ9Y6C2_9EUKA|nr:hypothetical protein BLNAU_5845 [Blattamonas nauphoetae]
MQLEILFLLPPFIPRTVPFTLVADTSTNASNPIKFKTALHSSVGLDVDKQFTDALKREGDISRVSQLHRRHSGTRRSRDTHQHGVDLVGRDPARGQSTEPDKLSTHQPTSLFQYHPFFSRFIRIASPISQAILDPLKSFTSASSHPSRLARIVRIQNNAFVRCLLPLVKASSFDLNTSAHNLQQLGIGIYRSFSDGFSDSISPTVLSGGRRPSQKGPLEWNVDSGLDALLETDS